MARMLHPNFPRVLSSLFSSSSRSDTHKTFWKNKMTPRVSLHSGLQRRQSQHIKQALLHTKASRKEMPFLQEKKRQIGKQGSSAHFGKRNSQGLAQLLLASLISRKSGIQTQNGQREGARTASLRNCSLVPALFGYASLKPCGWS